MYSIQQPVVTEEVTLESSNEKADSQPRATENLKILT